MTPWPHKPVTGKQARFALELSAGYTGAEAAQRAGVSAGSASVMAARWRGLAGVMAIAVSGQVPEGALKAGQVIPAANSAGVADRADLAANRHEAETSTAQAGEVILPAVPPERIAVEAVAGGQTVFTPHDVLNRLVAIADCNVARMFVRDGGNRRKPQYVLRDLADLGRDALAIESIETRKDGTVRVKLAPKIPALRMLGEHFAMFGRAGGAGSKLDDVPAEDLKVIDAQVAYEQRLQQFGDMLEKRFGRIAQPTGAD